MKAISLYGIRNLLGFLFSFSAFSVSAQSGLLKGVVLDSTSKDPVSGASIYLLSDKSTGIATDDGGSYSLSLMPGTYTLVCSYIGYNADTFIVVIAEAKATTYNVLITQMTSELSTVVVSAGKYEQKLEDITVSMEVLKPKLIESKNTINVTEALEQVPGLNILDEEPQIRGGSGFSFGVGSRVTTLVDGIPLLRGDIGKPEWSFIPVENLEQVEVIKGASSVLYGSSALSGVINFITKYPTEPHQTRVRLYSGGYSAPQTAGAKWWDGLANFSGLNINHAMRFDHFDVILGGQFLYDHGYIGPPVINPNLPFTQDTISNNEVSDRSARFDFNFRWRPVNVKGLSLGVNGNIMRQRSNFSLIWGDDSTNIYRAYPNTMTLTNNLELYVDPFVTYYTSSGLGHHFKSRFYRHNNEDPGLQRTGSDVYYAEYQLSKEPSKITGLHFTLGALTNQSVTQDSLYTNTGSTTNKLHNYAAYVQLDKKLWNIVNLSLGFRGEYFQINSEETTVKPIFRAGGNIQLAQGSFIRMSYGQGFRYPTIAEKFIKTTVGGLTVFPNPDLMPESSWNSEIGYKQALGFGKWFAFFDAALFWQEYHNTIEYNYALWSPDSAGFKFVNTGNSRVRGIDISLSGDGKITRNISLTVLFGYTYTLPQTTDPHYVYAVENPGEGFIPKQLSYVVTSSDTTNYILKYRFQHLAKIDVEASYKMFTSGFSLRYYSFMQNIDKTFYDIDKSGTLPSGITNYRAVHNKGDLVADARISYTFAKHYKLALVSSNIFNREYSLRPLKIEPPRTIAIQLRADI
jgi:iron complex outermembrane receptor protein